MAMARLHALALPALRVALASEGGASHASFRRRPKVRVANPFTSQKAADKRQNVKLAPRKRQLTGLLLDR